MKNFIQWVIIFFATGAFSGFMPKAPGTAGTLVAIPIVYFTANCSVSFHIYFWLTLFFLGAWVAKSYDEMQNTQDNSKIVIDEIVGFGLAAYGWSNNTKMLLLAFVFFRFFDIFKIFPAKQFDIWSKHKAKGIFRGFCIMMDDVMAGLQTWLVLFLVQKIL
ncbi:MAG: phosphatidylglycerophosphatase A [Bdellovibrio sp.]|nr:phosphatidylglycerophosphatase A [Bdellovibrio sp.]